MSFHKYKQNVDQSHRKRPNIYLYARVETVGVIGSGVAQYMFSTLLGVSFHLICLPLPV
jgi:hypothetical protein